MTPAPTETPPRSLAKIDRIADDGAIREHVVNPEIARYTLCGKKLVLVQNPAGNPPCATCARIAARGALPRLTPPQWAVFRECVATHDNGVTCPRGHRGSFRSLMRLGLIDTAYYDKKYDHAAKAFPRVERKDYNEYRHNVEWRITPLGFAVDAADRAEHVADCKLVRDARGALAWACGGACEKRGAS